MGCFFAPYVQFRTIASQDNCKSKCNFIKGTAAVIAFAYGFNSFLHTKKKTMQDIILFSISINSTVEHSFRF